MKKILRFIQNVAAIIFGWHAEKEKLENFIASLQYGIRINKEFQEKSEACHEAKQAQLEEDLRTAHREISRLVGVNKRPIFDPLSGMSMSGEPTDLYYQNVIKSMDERMGKAISDERKIRRGLEKEIHRLRERQKVLNKMENDGLIERPKVGKKK